METPKATYRQLGKSGLRVSVPILGCMSYGSDKWMDWVMNPEEALPILKAAYDMGVTTWDTANVYSNGDSEKVIATALKKYEIPREEIVIMTKCFFGVAKEMNTRFNALTQDRPEYNNQLGLSRAAIFNQVEGSLKRLETDYIDVLQIHRYDKNVDPEEVMCALNDLVKSGKVRYIGASSMWAYQFAALQNVAEKNGYTKFISMQDYYNLLYREEEREMIPYCKMTGVGLIPWSPLSAGALARPVSNVETLRAKVSKASNWGRHVDAPAGQEINKRVEEIAKKRGWSMAEVALSWVNGKVTSPIVGVSSIKRLEEALSSVPKLLTEEEIKYLEEPYIPQKISGHM
ncbi:NADP-dependent oxidoreductase domain-containing protein [Lipomyces arxii]|uniref:NADP-dependent oxidoreductase domain-containing protein n=1 Tax=Lipomyces arxii TaxID=56418 RepID=UPI0034CFE1AF